MESNQVQSNPLQPHLSHTTWHSYAHLLMLYRQNRQQLSEFQPILMAATELTGLGRGLSSSSAVGETTGEVGLIECHYSYLNLINKH